MDTETKLKFFAYNKNTMENICLIYKTISLLLKETH